MRPPFRKPRQLVGRWMSLLALLLFACGNAFAATPLSLQRGVNLSQWLEYPDAPAVSAQELVVLRQAGFDHVRIPFNPVTLGWDPRRGPMLPQVAKLHEAVNAAMAAGLDVIVDMHPDDKTKNLIQDDPVVSEAFVNMWRTLAKGFVDVPVDRVAFELLNEPAYEHRPASVWNDYQAHLVREVRTVLPQHTLILTGRKGGNPEGLAELVPLHDPHVIYNFHYYLPFIFTHQGAPWMRDDPWTTAAHWHGVLYPAALAKASEPTVDSGASWWRAFRDLHTYYADDWNRAAIAEQLKPAQDWAQANHVRVICDEFGVIRAGVDPASRYRWIADVRSLVEANHWGWAIWNYADDFGIAARPAGRTDGPATLDQAALSALGLHAGSK